MEALSTSSSLHTWYAALVKPSFNPPNWIFAPVWTILYEFMAVAAWRVWRTSSAGSGFGYRRSGLMLFAIQLLLNALWTPMFFYLHQLLGALVVIVCLGVTIFLMILRFWKADRLAGSLMIPYLLWVCFATVLNFAIYRLN